MEDLAFPEAYQEFNGSPCSWARHVASTAMNVVLAEEAADIAGVKPGPMFRQTPNRPLGQRLRELLHAVEEPGYPGGILATDAWAVECGNNSTTHCHVGRPRLYAVSNRANSRRRL